MPYEQLSIPGIEVAEDQPAFISGTHPDVDWQALVVNGNRCRLLEKLYEMAGRGNPEVAGHHTYTGLMEDFHYALGRATSDLLLREPDFDPEWLFAGQGNVGA